MVTPFRFVAVAMFVFALCVGIACGSSSGDNADANNGQPLQEAGSDGNGEAALLTTLTVTVAPATVMISAGSTATMAVHVVRQDPSDSDVVLTFDGLPTGVTVSQTTIPSGSNDATATFTAMNDAAQEVSPVTVTGTTLSGYGLANATMIVRGAPGALDTSFSNAGAGFIQTTALTANAVAVDGSGNVILGGNVTPSGGGAAQAWVARYSDLFTPDTTFGDAGAQTVSFGTGADGGEAFYAMLVSTDGTILGAGNSNTGGPQDQIVAARFFGDGGHLDPSFGSGGETVASYASGFGSRVAGAVFDSSNRAVLLGTVPSANGEWAFARFGLTGALDPIFGTSGATTIPTTTQTGGPACAAFQSNGAIVAGGDNFGTGAPTAPTWQVNRLTAAGAVDGTYAGVNVVWPGAGSAISACAVDGSDNVVVAGALVEGASYEYVIARYTSAGVLDPLLTGGDGGTGGPIKIALGTAGPPIAGPRGLFVTPDKKIVVVGSSPAGPITAVRLNADGSRDTTFGQNGVTTTNAQGTVADAALVIGTAYDAARSRAVLVFNGHNGGDVPGIIFARVWL